MKFTSTKEIKLKDGKSFPVGSICDITFNGSTQAVKINVVAANVTFSAFARSLPSYFSKIKVPSLKTMEKWSDDGIAKSVLGHKVEPDGFDHEGSPSWLIVMGLI